jgi:hypothetical protein
MKELSGRASAVLGRYRAVESLRETEKGRLLDALQARVARGDMPHAGADVSPPSPAPSIGPLERLWSAPFAKTGIGVMSVAAAALVAVVATRPKATPSAPVRVALADDPGTLNHARPEPLPLPATATSVEDPAPPPAAAPAKPRPKAAPRSEAASPRDTAGEATVDQEVALLRDAQLALRSGDPRRAMVLLSEHASKFPSGKLSDAREVTRVVALCDLGQRAAARAQADQFLARHPGSPFSDRVRRICVDSGR